MLTPLPAPLRCHGLSYPTPQPTHRKNVWCSMHTFHSRLAERWLGSLKPMVLSNCSYWEAKKGGLELGPPHTSPSAHPLLSRCSRM